MIATEDFLKAISRLDPPDFSDYGDFLRDVKIPQRVADQIERSREYRLKGLLEPKAGFGPFRQMLDGAICLADQTAVTGTTETALWPVSQYTGWASNQLRSGQLWFCTAAGIITTASSSQGNITLTPRLGTSSGGTGLGASVATALAASATNVGWWIDYLLAIRSIGAAGANSNVVGHGKFTTTVAAIAASTGNVVPMTSTASVAVDASISEGFYMGVTLGSASDSMKTLTLPLESFN